MWNYFTEIKGNVFESLSEGNQAASQLGTNGDFQRRRTGILLLFTCFCFGVQSQERMRLLWSIQVDLVIFMLSQLWLNV